MVKDCKQQRTETVGGFLYRVRRREGGEGRGRRAPSLSGRAHHRMEEDKKNYRVKEKDEEKKK